MNMRSRKGGVRHRTELPCLEKKVKRGRPGNRRKVINGGRPRPQDKEREAEDILEIFPRPPPIGTGNLAGRGTADKVGEKNKACHTLEIRDMKVPERWSNTDTLSLTRDVKGRQKRQKVEGMPLRDKDKSESYPSVALSREETTAHGGSGTPIDRKRVTGIQTERSDR